ncbi:MAG: exo-alpha-sialidase [Chlorobi bacterium]|nr:exo-alpha-sialidase [Chlorobiota bacterium]
MILVSKDKGRTWQIRKSIFPSLGGGQRPALIRFKSGRLLYAGDFQRKDGFQPSGITKRGSFVALSNDEGKTFVGEKLRKTG